MQLFISSNEVFFPILFPFLRLLGTGPSKVKFFHVNVIFYFEKYRRRLMAQNLKLIAQYFPTHVLLFIILSKIFFSLKTFSRCWKSFIELNFQRSELTSKLWFVSMWPSSLWCFRSNEAVATKSTLIAHWIKARFSKEQTCKEKKYRFHLSVMNFSTLRDLLNSGLIYLPKTLPNILFIYLAWTLHVKNQYTLVAGQRSSKRGQLCKTQWVYRFEVSQPH